jgi:hypothetical protein
MQEKIDHNERQNGSNEPGLPGVRQYRPDENRRSQMGQQQPCQLAGCLATELGAGLLGAGIFRIYEEREETFEGRILN